MNDSRAIEIHDLYELYVDDDLPRDRVVARWSDQARRSHPALDADIERRWEQLSREARQHDRIWFNGTLARLVSWEYRSPVLYLTLGPTTFKELMGTNATDAHRIAQQYGRQCLANALGITVCTRTSDGYLLLGRRSNRVAIHPGHVQGIGGTIPLVDNAAGCVPDVFEASMMELREELRVSDDEVRNLRVTQLLHLKGLLYPELLLGVDCELTADELLSRHMPDAADEEHTELLVVAEDPDAIREFVSCQRPMVVLAGAMLLLHGRRLWGQDWYTQSLPLIADLQE